MSQRERQDEGRTLKRANPKTIQDKFLVGYQGWFTCAGDGDPVGPGHHGWLHWFNGPIPSGGRPNTDLWPDVSEYLPSELYPAPGLKNADGEQLFLFSSRRSETVRRHFHWMALHGVDGAFLQRFAGQCDMEAGNQGIRNIRDEVGMRVKEAAEAEGRVFAIMYDVSGVSPDKIQRILKDDWEHLLRNQRLLDSPNYLREKGRPVVALWGFGFDGRHHTPELVRSIADSFRSTTAGGVYLVAGVPGHWRTSNSDADRNPEFVRVWTESFDMLSPWTVGRYGNEEDADRWGEERVKADADFLKKLEEDGGRRVDYMPVVLPGGSGYNLSQGKWGMNDIKRNGGRFLWKQIYNARRAGVRTIYGAMWDEYDEGTAFMPVVSSSSQLPVHPSYNFLALDADGYDLPSDWYMRVVGFAAEGFHSGHMLSETFPVKELQDYWGTRPHYEEVDVEEEEKKRLEEAGRAFRVWEAAQGSGGGVEEAPPPPYTEEEINHPQEALQQRALPDQAPARHSSGGALNATTPFLQDPGPAPTFPSRHSSLTASSSGPPPALPGRHSSLSAVGSSSSSSSLPSRSQSARPPVVDMSSRPPPSLRPSTKPQYPPEKVEVVLAPPVLPSRRPASSHSRPSASPSVSALADDFAQQSSITSPSPGSPSPSLHQPGSAAVSHLSPNPVMNMPSVSTSSNELGPRPGAWRPPSHSPRPSTSSGIQSQSWHPGLGPDNFYNPPYLPSSPAPRPVPQHTHPSADPAYFHQAPQHHPQGGWAVGPQGSYDPMDYPRQPNPYAPAPQDVYYSNQSMMGGHHPQPPTGPYPQYGYDGTHSPHSPQSPPPMMYGGMPPPPIPARPPMHPQSSGPYASYQPPAPVAGGSSGGGGFNLAGINAWDAFEGLAGKDRRRHLEKKVTKLTQTGTSLMNKLK
ncbi:hypothetical protein HYDPIDRAFT_43251 [Hydnomerulius pinastri MD-312]|uniref:Xylosidase/arabinosidase n=1 Tax=Hydnomerulius pinastri MD-312 TaxID=994086 RepID=A0A0C9VRV1_9AGAM|nr:hypothetical protein HYDPIDRAFT_43251 [Hydnomerulius pinastri MD-312]